MTLAVIISCSQSHHMWNYSCTAVSISKACNTLSKVWAWFYVCLHISILFIYKFSLALWKWKSLTMFLSPFRLYCPRNCLEENPHISRVIGTRIYSDVSFFRLTTDVEIELNELTFFFLHNLSSCILLQKSSICRAAVHAGVFRNDVGGYIDVMPVDKRKHYIASYQNGIFSERYGMPYTVVCVSNAWVNCSPKTSHFSSPKPARV